MISIDILPIFHIFQVSTNQMECKISEKVTACAELTLDQKREFVAARIIKETREFAQNYEYGPEMVMLTSEKSPDEVQEYNKLKEVSNLVSSFDSYSDGFNAVN